MSGNDPAPASVQLGFADVPKPMFCAPKDVQKKETTAAKAVLVSESEKLASDQSTGRVIVHGHRDERLRVDVTKESTFQGEYVPAPWTSDGKLSEVYLQKGGKFEEKIMKVSGDKVKSETSKVLKDPAHLGPYFEKLSQADQELKQLHVSHISADTKTVDFESILQKMSPLGSDETLVAKLACKALINAPATGYDIVSDLVLAMTRIKCDTAPGGFQRRVYFFHAAEHESLSGSNLNSDLKTGYCCNVFKEQVDKQTESITFAMQTSIYMDYLSVEDQIVQMFYQQVDGTKVNKDHQNSEFHSSCPRCQGGCCCCIVCPDICGMIKACLYGAEGKDTKHDLETRTAKALKELLVTESKLLTTERKGDVFSTTSTTEVKLSNFNAIHFRWVDPLTQQLKETVALVSPTEPALTTCAFVGMAARAPNQLLMVAGAAAPPKLGFAPGKSAVDNLRKQAVEIPEVFGASPGDGFLAGFGGAGASEAAVKAWLACRRSAKCCKCCPCC